MIVNGITLLVKSGRGLGADAAAKILTAENPKMDNPRKILTCENF